VIGLAFGARGVMASLFVLFGLIIVGRGVLVGAPVTYVAMGILLAALGFYRLRLLRRQLTQVR
jgi:hypothetical protein